MLVPEFSHGWTKGHHTFRVEARLENMEMTYSFSINGSNFVNWPRNRPRREGNTSLSDDTGGYGGGRYDRRDSGDSRGQSSTFSSQSNNDHIFTSTSAVSNGGNDFDPFADSEGAFGSSSGASFDPFAKN